ncbi:LysE family transporter [Rhodobacterales bacterium HKCCE2091]|nr:LysE family transporter [Rhodobacterales bacterium HKCCE2091]
MIATLPALALFAIAATITPGPNNIMLLASGANFGLRRTIPHLAGIALGFGGMIALIGFALLNVFELVPGLRTVILALSAVYLLYLAWKVANAAPPKEAEAEARPLTFLQAAAFQWVNPKAWYMAIYAQTTFAPDGPVLAGALLVGAVFAICSVPCTTIWAWGGVQVRRILSTHARLRVFNITMALLLVASLYPALTR